MSEEQAENPGDGAETTASLFLQECRDLGYQPTPVEISLYFRRNAFRLFDFEMRDDSLFPDCVTDQAGKEQVLKNLKQWGEPTEILKDPARELATHLIVDVFTNMQLEGPEDHGKHRDRKIRDTLVRGGNKATAYPWEQTITAGFRYLEREPWWQRLNPLSLGARRQVTQKRNQITDQFGFGPGVIGRIDLEKTTSACMQTQLQATPSPSIERTVAVSIATLYGNMGLERYADPQTASKALNLASQALEPIKPELVYHINSRLGLLPQH